MASSPSLGPEARRMGSISPRPSMTGASRARMGTMRTRMGPRASSPASGWARRRRTESLVATVSARGERRSWGRVSQAGKTAMSLGGR